MPNDAGYTDIQSVWMGYTNSVRILLVPIPDDRPMDQYLAFRDKVILMVQDQKFLNELQQAWPSITDAPKTEIGEALLMELKAFPLALEVAKATEKDTREFKGWFGRWLGRASTVTGSVKDLVDNLPAYAKGAITLFKELIDLFRGKD